jgi:protein-tyrosine phosphatase
MIDIHSHILWGVDDGAASLEDSIAMLELARETGTTDIVATPHSNGDFEYRPALVQERIQELAARTSGGPTIHRGCDFHLSFDNIDHLLENPSVYTIAGKQFLLVECPDFHVGPHTELVLRRLIDAGLVPVVTHPERNPVLQKNLDRVEQWVEIGCLVQVTALSVTAGFGSAATTACHRLLSRGLVHVVASDAHDPKHRNTRLDKARAVVCDRYGEDAAEVLFTENPRNILRGAPVIGGRQKFLGAQKSWWQFWK